MSLANEVMNNQEARRAYEEELLYGEATDTISGLLESLSISKNEVASRLGVSPGRVSQIFSGRENLTLRTLASLAWSLGMKVSFQVEPMENRSGTPAENDPAAPAWLGDLSPKAGVRFTEGASKLPASGRLGIDRKKLHICSRASDAA